MSEFSHSVQAIAAFAIPVLFAIALHEAAHGYTARYFGDPTAEQAGRLSLNPVRHIDLFGTILLPLLLYLSPIGVPFGYAKPVPVDFGRLRNPKKQMGFVAAAGPAANFAMCLGWMIVLVLLRGMGVGEAFFLEMARAGVLANAAMCVFNLIPVPPLDGGRIVTALLPMDLARSFASIERYTTFIFIGLIALSYFNVLGNLLAPAMGVLLDIVKFLVQPLTYLFR
ncbi:site-2 protease family protein [Massilia sp. TS11]|uniref:site-2 protease family protein n=1 Tax=Massilia sp. TS11 TaxID=2908003 RepID=UPI001EDBA325|nr:site-2 protease family protein [Massilia sp. TS11]MCG2582962.1 site-2 protease family protein [Massilia sp. TS11]